MNIQQLLNKYQKIPTQDLFQIVKHVKRENLTSLLSNLDQLLTNEEICQIETAVKRYNNEEPIAYIVGEKEFYEDKFMVNPSTLIPRPETEYLIDIIHNIISSHPKNSLNILEVGTGSGCISISLIKTNRTHKTLNIYATEIDKEALAIAKQNANNLLSHQEIGQIKITQADILPDRTATKYDLIVSNPPYITTTEMYDLPRSVREFEPEIALHGGEDGLDIYKRIIKKTQNNITPETLYIFEAQPTIMKGLKALMSNKKTFHDQYRRERFLSGKPILSTSYLLP